MVLGFTYWEVYDACLYLKDGTRKWRFYRAAEFGDDLYILTCSENTNGVRTAISEACDVVKYLGAASFKKDKDTGEDRAEEYHWLIRI